MILDQYGNAAIVDRPQPRVRAYWDAGQTGRRLRAIPTSTRSINSLIRSYGSTVLARSRYLSANNSYAAMAREAYVAAMVGAGIAPSPLLDDAELKKEVQQTWTDWTDEADADGLTDFYGLQTLVAGEMFEAGEVFIRLRQRRPDDGLIVPLQLQVLPGEMLDTNYNLDVGAGRRIECGIQFNAIGKREGYHFWRNHPGNDQVALAPSGSRSFVPADEVFHLYRPIRAGQIRGVPHTLSALVRLAILDLYDDAELERKKTAALFAAFVTREFPPEPEDDPLLELPGQQQQLAQTAPTSPGAAEADQFYAIESGATVPMLPGEDIKFSEPADVGETYEPFQLRQLLAIAAGMGVPYMDMTGDLRQANYGSMRAGMIQFRRRVEATQHGVMVYQLCRPVYNRWWTEAVLAGAVRVSPADFARDQRSFRRVEWIPPHWEWIDPEKDLKAEVLAVENRFKSRSAVIKATGQDPEVVDDQIRLDREREDELGNTPAPPQPAAQAAPAQQPSEPAERPAATAAAMLNRAAQRHEVAITVGQPDQVRPPVAAAPPEEPAKSRTIKTHRDEAGNLIAVVEETVGGWKRSKIIRTSRDDAGNLMATVEEGAD